MFSNDDQNSAEPIDRIIAAVIAGFCGYFLGALFGLLLGIFSIDALWVKWVVAAAFAVFGFLAPTRSRDLWTQFWNELLGYFLRGR